MGRPLDSFRHTTLLVAASRQERTPPMPYVQILPSATAGELRGPPWLPHIPRAAPTPRSPSYLSCHPTLPVAASTQVVTSWSPWRANTYTLSPTRAGVASPLPTVIRHFCFNSFGHVAGAVNA